jgi:uncharacterized protein (TIGR00369 family)
MTDMSVASLQEFLDGAFPIDTPYVIDAVDDASIDVRLVVGPGHGRPGDTISGPSLMALVDTAAWLAILAQIGPVALAVTTSLHIDFLRKPELVDVIAHGELLKLGSRLAVVHVTIRSVAAEAVVASAQVTYSIPPR